MVIRIINLELHDTVAGLSGRPLDHGERASKPRQRWTREDDCWLHISLFIIELGTNDRDIQYVIHTLGRYKNACHTGFATVSKETLP